MRPLLVMGLDGVTIDWARTVLRMAMYLAGVVILRSVWLYRPSLAWA